MSHKPLKKNKLIVLLALIIAPAVSFGQHFQQLYDNDSTNDWGWCVLNRPDSNCFVLGWSLNEMTGLYTTFSMIINNDDGRIIAKNEIALATATTVGPGNWGEIKNVPAGGYIAPLTVQWPDPVDHYYYSAIGLMKLNSYGDTIFLKTYTDTSIYFGLIESCATMPDSGYIAGGQQSLNTSTTPATLLGYIIRTDSLGDTLWTRTYQHDTSDWVDINNLIPLSDGRIAVGAQNTHYSFDGSDAYYHNAPWFMLLDSMGNIIRDTLYDNDFGGCGFIYKDTIEGYLHLGSIDTFETRFPEDPENFPSYIAHLDTNFRVEWLTRLPYSAEYGHRFALKAVQLHDGNFIVAGDAEDSTSIYVLAWAAKIDRSGNILWNQYYTSDSSYDAHFRDVAERADGSLVFTGAAYNDTLPSWHGGQDMWLVVTDSNGCVTGGCFPAQVTSPQPAPKDGEMISVWPNPTHGDITLQVEKEGAFTLYTLLGQEVQTYKVTTGDNELQLPANIAAGVYVGEYRATDNSMTKQVRIVYEP